MFSNLLIGVDGGPGGRDAVALARRLAPSGAALTLVHVRLLENPARRGHASAFAAARRQASSRILEHERTTAAPGAEIVSVAAGSVGAGLHDLAESRGGDLVVVGSCSRSPVGRVFAGDDTRGVLHRAPCAVAVAPRGYAARPSPIGVVGVAYDGSLQSRVALRVARALGSELDAKVMAHNLVQLRVYGASAFAVPALEDPVTRLELARRELGHLDGATLSVAIGPREEGMAAFSAKVDLLVCGSRQNGIIKRVALGSTSDYLSHHCACPLIVTPAAVAEPLAPVDSEHRFARTA